MDLLQEIESLDRYEKANEPDDYSDYTSAVMDLDKYGSYLDRDQVISLVKRFLDEG